MQHKVQVIIDRFVKLLSSFDGVECITLNEAALPAALDPYFALILDVFCSGKIPEPKERLKLYGDDISAFESSGMKDRFFLHDCPIHFEFKTIKNIEDLVHIVDADHDSLWLVKDAGTYTYYRLANGEVLFSRNDWISGIRKRLTSLNDKFWVAMRQASQSKMGHFLSDLGAAVIQKDMFFYRMSAAGFIKNVCLTLFCINKQFEPSHRAYYKKVTSLPILSESFCAQLETFLRSDETNIERRYGLAKAIAKGIMEL
ncbi:MAG: hypothetical protein Ta2B_26980 [Termitinemataceae bacterium]|nr:MAG: hypothetical protein Ta2B_26980 [Termitinemataceae bacterium]